MPRREAALQRVCRSVCTPLLLCEAGLILGETALAETFAALTAQAMVVVDAIGAGGLLGTHVEAEVVIVACTLKIGDAGCGVLEQGEQEEEEWEEGREERFIRSHRGEDEIG